MATGTGTAPALQMTPDGKIKVKPGDWLSKYSLALYGNVTTLNVFARWDDQKNAIKEYPIKNVDLLTVGETILHYPTWEEYNRGKGKPPDPCPPGPTVPAPLTTPMIKARLDAASWMEKDNEARNIINGATPQQLYDLDVEGVLRLYVALTEGVIELSDRAALRTLARHMKYQPQPLAFTFKLAKATISDARVQSLLTIDVVNRIYAAEAKRYTPGEDYWPWALTFGRGQLGQPAYLDVMNNNKKALRECLAYARLRQIVESAFPARPTSVDWVLYQMNIPAQYEDIYTNTMVEDFVVTAYLGLKIKISGSKAGRSDVQTLRFAVAVYHGMFDMVAWAQGKVSDENNWDLVEAYLRSSCTHPKKKGEAPRPVHTHPDECDYIHEVVP